MRTLRGPSLHLAQFADDAAPFNSLPSIAQWAAGVGFKALQIPAWDGRLFDVETAAESQAYCDDMKGMLAEHGLEISELTTHIFGQLVAVHPAYDAMCDNFAPEAVRGNPAAHCVGAGSPQAGGAGFTPPGADRHGHFFGFVRVALPVSVPATARRPHRDGFR